MKKILFTTVFSFFYFAGFTQSVPSFVPANGLISYWGFDGNANDYNSSNDGTIINATLTTDRFGTVDKAYSFNGSNSRIIVPNSSNLSNFDSVTISGWFNTNSFLTDQGLVTKWFQQLDCSSNSDNYSCLLSNNIYTNNNPALIGATNNYTGYSLQSTFFLQTNVWYNFVFVHNNLNGGQLYINGNLTAQINTQGTLCTSTNPLIIGADNNFNTITRFFSGKLDDIGIWNRALTPNEIATMYQQGTLNTNQQTLTNFKVYPNPATNKLIIENLENDFVSDYKIIDQLGREVMDGKLFNDYNIIDINNLLNGIYIVNIKGITSRNIKFIKN